MKDGVILHNSGEKREKKKKSSASGRFSTRLKVSHTKYLHACSAAQCEPVFMTCLQNAIKKGGVKLVSADIFKGI